MSKKDKQRHRNKRDFPWPIIAFGAILLIVAAFLFARQPEVETGTPSVAVDQEMIDYGDVKFGVSKTFAVTVTNTGDGTLRFIDKPYIQVLEGC